MCYMLMQKEQRKHSMFLMYNLKQRVIVPNGKQTTKQHRKFKLNMQIVCIP